MMRDTENREKRIRTKRMGLEEQKGKAGEEEELVKGMMTWMRMRMTRFSSKKR